MAPPVLAPGPAGPSRAPLVPVLAALVLGLTCCGAPTPPTAEPGSASSSTAPPTAAPDSPGPASSTASAAPRTATVNVSGDLLWNEALFEGARVDDGFDFRPQLASLRPFVAQADLAVCHQEVPLAQAHGPYSGWPRFRAPQETALAVAATGFDVCTTASNHTMDDGWPGLIRTLDVLHRAGIGTTGTSATEAEAQAPDLFTTEDGVVVAIVSQTFALNGLPRPPGKEWSVDLIDVDEAVEDARAARAAGADVVILHMHAGTEYVREPNALQTATAEAATASGEFDLVVGQHPHWVQPVEKVHGTWVVYSTGNLIASMRGERPGTHDGAMVEAEFTEEPDGRFEVSRLTWAPTFITDAEDDPTGRPRVLLIPDELDTAPPALRARLEASAARTRAVITAGGAAGLTERGVDD